MLVGDHYENNNHQLAYLANDLTSDLTYLASDLTYLGSDLTYLASDLAYLASDLTYLVSDLTYLASDLTYLASDLTYLASDLTYLASDLTYLANDLGGRHSLRQRSEMSKHICIFVYLGRPSQRSHRSCFNSASLIRCETIGCL
jgi:hypothetical protein